MNDAAPVKGRCTKRRKDGQPCRAQAIAGTDACRRHCGVAPEAQRAKGAVVVELRRWGLGDATVDPAEVMLRLVSQSAARVQLYSSELEAAYDAAGRLAAANEVEAIELLAPETRTRFVGEDEIEMPEHAARQVARADLDRIFLHGPIAALVGHKYAATKDGDIYPAGEAIRGLAELEAQERDRCAGFAAKAIAAGLAERQVRVAERQGREMAGVFRRVIDQLGLSAEQLAAVPGLLARELGSLTGKNLIDGSVA